MEKLKIQHHPVFCFFFLYFLLRPRQRQISGANEVLRIKTLHLPCKCYHHVEPKTFLGLWLFSSKGPYAPNSKSAVPNPNLLTNLETHISSLPRLPGHWRDICQMERSQHLKGKHYQESSVSEFCIYHRDPLWTNIVLHALSLSFLSLTLSLNRWNCVICVWEIKSIPHWAATVQKDIV